MTGLTHLTPDGSVHMVDVGSKAETKRTAVAFGTITASQEALALIRSGTAKKGDVLAVARVAGIMATKKTSDLIPLCHPLPLSSAEIDIELDENAIHARATVSTTGKTGVEMEALTAVSMTLLTIYDMLKSVDRGMEIENIRLISKTGGKSDWNAD